MVHMMGSSSASMMSSRLILGVASVALTYIGMKTAKKAKDHYEEAKVLLNPPQTIGPQRVRPQVDRDVPDIALIDFSYYKSNPADFKRYVTKIRDECEKLFPGNDECQRQLRTAAIQKAIRFSMENLRSNQALSKEDKKEAIEAFYKEFDTLGCHAITGAFRSSFS